jgi:hypothetical protein
MSWSCEIPDLRIWTGDGDFRCRSDQGEPETCSGLEALLWALVHVAHHGASEVSIEWRPTAIAEWQVVARVEPWGSGSRENSVTVHFQRTEEQDVPAVGRL